MSQENVEIVRLAYERFNSGDVDGVLQLCSKEFEFRDLPALPGSGVFVGHDSFRDWYRRLTNVFDGLRFATEEFIDAGEQVVVINHGIGIGTGSGATVEMHFTNVWKVTDGELVSGVSYDSHTEALEAAGLSE